MKAIIVLLLSLFFLNAQSVFCADTKQPNIVILLADDAGYSDVGCFGAEIKTPNIDRLAAQGLRFSQFYNCALCGPTRSCLMSGLHPHQVGVAKWTGLMNQRCATICELLKQAGYATYALGRLDMVTAEDWHDPTNIAHHLDRFFGSTGHTGAGNYFKAVRTCDFFLDGKPFTLPIEGNYNTDLITDYAVKFIEEAAEKPRPFFMYMAHYAPHWPLQAKPQDIARYRALYRKLGWDEARAGRYQRLLEMGLIAKSCKLSPRDPRAVAWENVPSKDWEAERMATYAAQIDCMDQSIGRVMEALHRTGADQNTLVIFLSDNGASDQSPGTSIDKGQTWRVDGTPTRQGNAPDILPGPADTFVTSGPAWSNVQNCPFRNHKNTNFEGGIATPFVAWWPGVIEHGGAITHEWGHVADFMPTCLEVAGVKYPAEFAGRKLQPLMGKSLLPIFKGGTFTEPRVLGWETSGSRALRDRKWKIVAAAKGDWELYDMETDRTEINDLAKQNPQELQELAEKWRHWAE